MNCFLFTKFAWSNPMFWRKDFSHILLELLLHFYSWLRPAWTPLPRLVLEMGGLQLSWHGCHQSWSPPTSSTSLGGSRWPDPAVCRYSSDEDEVFVAYVLCKNKIYIHRDGTIDVTHQWSALFIIQWNPYRYQLPIPRPKYRYFCFLLSGKLFDK